MKVDTKAERISLMQHQADIDQGTELFFEYEDNAVDLSKLQNLIHEKTNMGFTANVLVGAISANKDTARLILLCIRLAHAYVGMEIAKRNIDRLEEGVAQ